MSHLIHASKKECSCGFTVRMSCNMDAKLWAAFSRADHRPEAFNQKRIKDRRASTHRLILPHRLTYKMLDDPRAMAMKVSVFQMSGQMTIVEVMPDTKISDFKWQLTALQSSDHVTRRVTTVELVLDGQKLEGDENATLLDTGISAETEVHVLFSVDAEECRSWEESGYDVQELLIVRIPDSETEILPFGFEGCSSLISITIPESVTLIGDSAFHGCSSLASLTIPNSVTSIAYSAFKDCSSLTSLAIPDSVTLIDEAAFQGCSSLGSLEIPNSLTCIRDCAFASCSSMRSLTIPNSVSSIRSAAFKNCSSLKRLTIPSSVTHIGHSAFAGCSSLSSLEILPSDSVTRIGESAFKGCSALKNLSLPESVADIGDFAFKGCSALQSLTILNPKTYLGPGAFDGTSLVELTIPDSLRKTFHSEKEVRPPGLPVESTPPD